MKGLSVPVVRRVADRLQRQYQELQFYDSDPQVKEAYRWLSKKQYRTLIALFEGIFADADKFIGNKNAQRKPRAKRVVSNEKKVANVKYLKESAEDQIVSVNPVKLVGANEAWLFNVRYGALTVLRSEAGFDVKGTSILNYDPETSLTKNIGRKRKEILTKAVNYGKRQLRKLMEEVNAKGQEAN